MREYSEDKENEYKNKYGNEYKEIAQKIKEADAILISASNGLSITEGLNLFANDDAFENLFRDYKEKYGFRRILDGFFFRWDKQEEKWGFLSRLINHYSANYTVSSTMKNLKAIVGDKPYFILTSNGEGHFELAGFEPRRIYEIEGNWIEMRCGQLCHEKTYPSLPIIRKLAEIEKNGMIPSEAIPKCPLCEATMDLYSAQPPKREVQMEWEKFCKDFHNKKIVILELGIGWRNRLIKAPLMRMTAKEPQATYVTINLGEVYITEDIKDKSYGLDGYLSEHLSEISYYLIH